MDDVDTNSGKRLRNDVGARLAMRESIRAGEELVEELEAMDGLWERGRSGCGSWAISEG